MLTHADPQLLRVHPAAGRGREPFWVVNEGEYRMMNTLDLTIDQSFFELTNEPVDGAETCWTCS